jgi:hypothetical protein
MLARSGLRPFPVGFPRDRTDALLVRDLQLGGGALGRRDLDGEHDRRRGRVLKTSTSPRAR